MYQVPDQKGRRIVVTGSNSGTGLEAAKRLAAAGAQVIMAVRSLDKGAKAKVEILQQVPSAHLEVRELDLACLSSVRTFAQTLLDEKRPLHTLVNNAGVMTPPKREETKDGFELQFGSNFLGPFALTNLLLPLLLRSGKARVATMTSSAAMMGKIDFDDLQSERKYKAMAAYSQSKLADLLMTLHLGDLAQRNGWDLLSTAAHPGYTRTSLLKNGPNRGTSKTGVAWYYRLVPSMSIPKGTEPILHAAAATSARQKTFYGPRFLMVGRTHESRIPAAARRSDPGRLWAEAERLTGVSTPRR